MAEGVRGRRRAAGAGAVRRGGRGERGAAVVGGEEPEQEGDGRRVVGAELVGALGADDGADRAAERRAPGHRVGLEPRLLGRRLLGDHRVRPLHGTRGDRRGAHRHAGRLRSELGGDGAAVDHPHHAPAVPVQLQVHALDECSAERSRARPELDSRLERPRRVGIGTPIFVSEYHTSSSSSRVV